MSHRDIPARPHVLYDLWEHWPSRQIYAIRREPDGDAWPVTGYVGPKPLDEWRRTPLEGLEYETERLEWIRAEREAGHFDLTG